MLGDEAASGNTDADIVCGHEVPHCRHARYDGMATRKCRAVGAARRCSLRRRGRPAVTFQRGTTDCEKTAIWEDSKTARNQCR